MNRLEVLAPKFFQESTLRGTEWLEFAAVRACEIAVSHTKLANPVVLAAIGLLREGGSEINEANVQAIADDLDDQYFVLNEETVGDTSIAALNLFSQARAVSAVAFAAKGDSQSSLECVYEAAMAFDDPLAFINELSAQIRDRN